MEQIIQIFPSMHAKQMSHLDFNLIEEIRAAVDQPVRIRRAIGEWVIDPCLSGRDIEEIVQTACRQSVYSYSESIRQGYLTLEGGHRLGIAGSGVVQDGTVQTIRAPTSLVLRIAHGIPGCADALISAINGSTLLLGPPGSGKTTILRDLIRQLSDFAGERISLVDERGEVSGFSMAGTGFSVGCRTDVMLRIPKAEAVMMMLRTMNPQWIALDEITAPEDIAAMETASYCGVKLLATAHGHCMEDLQRRPLYRKLMEMGIFSLVVLLHRDKTFELREV